MNVQQLVNVIKSTLLGDSVTVSMHDLNDA